MQFYFEDTFSFKISCVRGFCKDTMSRLEVIDGQFSNPQMKHVNSTY